MSGFGGRNARAKVWPQTLGLTEAHWRVLEALERGEHPTAATIAGTSKRPSIVRALSVLEYHRLVRDNAGEAGEATAFELTRSGREALRAAFTRYTPRPTGGAS